MKKIYFATGNKGKANEAEQILGVDIEIAPLELDEIQSMNLEDIVGHKVKQAYEKLKAPVFVDDVSLEVDIWKGFPGPFIKYLQQISNDLILYMMRNETNRKVKLIATIAYHDGEKIHYFSGHIPCTISTESRGDQGWGFDPIMIPDGQNLTFSQMTDEAKNSLSHRRIALDTFKKFLDSQKS
jgi:non-canonical purine NTP pyrophosphatase (RdgB/HAM1 family)